MTFDNDTEQSNDDNTMIYIVHTDAWDGDRPFKEIKDEEIERMYEEDQMFISCYNSIEELAASWNSDECFYPNMSYMRVVNK